MTMVSDDEIKRREYELKRNEFLFKVTDSYHERLFKIASSAIVGNLGALALFASVSKADGDKALLAAFQDAAFLFFTGAIFGLFALGGAFAVSSRRAFNFERIAAAHFPEDASDKRGAMFRLVSYVLVPFMTTICLGGSSAFFAIGLFVMMKR